MLNLASFGERVFSVFCGFRSRSFSRCMHQLNLAIVNGSLQRMDLFLQMEVILTHYHQQTVVDHHQSLLDTYRGSLGNMDAREQILVKDLAKRCLLVDTQTVVVSSARAQKPRRK
jgi:hypothetical protein